MSSALIRTPIVVDSFSSGAANVTISGNYINLAGLDTLGNAVGFSIYAPGGSASGGVRPATPPTPQVNTLTPTAANAALFSFVITQMNLETNQWQAYPFAYFSAVSGDTATSICNQFRKQIAAVANGGSLNVVATGTATLIITATTTNCLFYLSSVTANIAVANSMTAIASVTMSAASPAVFDKGSSDGLTTGQVITLSGLTTYTALNGAQFQVTTTGAHTSTLTYVGTTTPVNGDGTDTDSGTVTLQAANGFGQASFLSFLQNTLPAFVGQVTSGANYSALFWNGTTPGSPVNTISQPQNIEQTVWFNQGGANYAAAIAQLVADLVTFNALA